MAVAFKLQDSIHDMFQNLWACQTALLRDMAHEDDGYTAFFGILEQGGGALAHLCNRAGRGFHAFDAHRLDGVNDEQVGLHVLHLREYFLQTGFAEQEGAFATLQMDAAAARQSVGAQLDLPLALLTADVEHAALGERQEGLEQQCGFANAGLATQENQRARHESAAQHAVELRVV